MAVGQRPVALGICQIDRGLGRLHGLAELAVGGLGRGQRVQRQRDPAVSSLSTTCWAKIIAASGSRIWGSGLVAKAQAMKFQACTASLCLPRASNCPPNCSARPPLRLRQPGQQGPKTLFALAILTPLEPLVARPAYCRSVDRVPAGQFQRDQHCSQDTRSASSEFLRAMAILANPKQAWLKLLIVSRSFTLSESSFRISRYWSSALSSSFNRDIDLAEVQAGFQQGRIESTASSNCAMAASRFVLPLPELFCPCRFGRVGLAFGLRLAGFRFALLASPQQHAAEIIAGPRGDRLQSTAWVKCHSALSRNSSASFSLPSFSACVAASE